MLYLQLGGEDSTKEFDVYDEMLTQAEIQGNLNLVNSKYLLTIIFKIFPLKFLH